MTTVLGAAWTLVNILNYGGLLIALAGVAVFGWNFVRLNAAAGQGDGGAVPRDSWRGRRARLGYKIVAVGAAMLVAAIALTFFLPGRP